MHRLIKTASLTFLSVMTLMCAFTGSPAYAEEDEIEPQETEALKASIEAPATIDEVNLPIYILGALGKQHKIKLTYPKKSEGKDLYLLQILLQALDQSEGFKATGLNYVKMKLVYETQCPIVPTPDNQKQSECLPGLDEVIIKYNIEEDRVNRRFWWFKQSTSHFPEEHPFWFNVGRVLNLVDDDNYLSRTIQTVNNAEHPKNKQGDYMQLKMVTIYAPGVTESSLRQAIGGFLGNMARTGASGALAGVTAGIVNN